MDNLLKCHTYATCVRHEAVGAPSFASFAKGGTTTACTNDLDFAEDFDPEDHPTPAPKGTAYNSPGRKSGVLPSPVRDGTYGCTESCAQQSTDFTPPSTGNAQ